MCLSSTQSWLPAPHHDLLAIPDLGSIKLHTTTEYLLFDHDKVGRFGIHTDHAIGD